MDQESNQMEQHPVLCRNGCGFYSNNGTEGLCSVCYKDAIKKKQQPPTGMPASLAPAPGTMASLSIDESSVASSEASSPAKNSSVDTALPTVILPSSQTDKVRKIYFTISTISNSRNNLGFHFSLTLFNYKFAADT